MDRPGTVDRLLLDAMCGKLARYLRMCGYDAAYVLDDAWREGADDGGADTPAVADDTTPVADDEILERARARGRRIVTCDRELAGRADGAILLESRDITDQLSELLAVGFDLSLPEEPTRCGACNGPLQRVDPDVTTAEHVPDPDEEPMWRCVDCGQAFWRGSHWDDVAETLARVRADDGFDG